MGPSVEVRLRHHGLQQPGLPKRSPKLLLVECGSTINADLLLQEEPRPGRAQQEPVVLAGLPTSPRLTSFDFRHFINIISSPSFPPPSYFLRPSTHPKLHPTSRPRFSMLCPAVNFEFASRNDYCLLTAGRFEVLKTSNTFIFKKN